MKKQLYIFEFPKAVCGGESTITIGLNPLLVKDVAKQLIASQSLVFGDSCIIKDSHMNVLGIAYQGDNGDVKIFTEDDDVEQIKGTEDN